MLDSPSLFEEILSLENVSARSSRCVYCKGSKMLCGKERCSVIARFFSTSRAKQLIDRTNLDGASPPSVFVGRMGYPSVAIGPMIPPYHGDTSLMDTPERWVNLGIDDIIDFRSNLVRGMHKVDIHDVENSNKLVVKTRELALARTPPEAVAEFERKPFGKLTVDDDVQPFGPSAPIKRFDVANFRFDSRLEKPFYDTDLKAKDALVSLYRDGVLISQIQRAFSIGAFGIGNRRKFVPTRWSITAVDSNLGLHMLETTKTYPTIDEFRVYETTGLDNRWAIVMMPTSWRYELIEAWYPNTAWNPHSDRIAIMSDHEFFDGDRPMRASEAVTTRLGWRSTNSCSERGTRPVCPYSAKHILDTSSPSACGKCERECEGGTESETQEVPDAEGSTHVSTLMDIPVSRWIRNSAVLKDALYQRRLDDQWG